MPRAQFYPLPVGGCARRFPDNSVANNINNRLLPATVVNGRYRNRRFPAPSHGPDPNGAIANTGWAGGNICADQQRPN